MDAFGNLTAVWEIDPVLGSVNTGYSVSVRPTHLEAAPESW